MTSNTFSTIWPERHKVGAAQIREWFADAVANEKIAREYAGATDTATQARALCDAGLITLGQF